VIAKGESVIDSAVFSVRLQGSDSKSGKMDSSGDGLPSLEVASPPEFGGPAGVWSPEHLFVASVSACLMTTFRAIAERSGVDVVDYEDHASGDLVRGDDGFYVIETITLRPRVCVGDERQIEKAGRLILKAEGACLIGRSIQSQVKLQPTVISSGAD
jgi:peroxiredoxin-like protein